jgi:poly(A) polymerase
LNGLTDHHERSVDNTTLLGMNGDLPRRETEAGEADNPPDSHLPLVIPINDHSISRRDIDPDAQKVIYRLIRQGFTAYLVGGGVRDLLLGRSPKDFDISTNARPEEVRGIFHNCYLIGRRFRLAHIRFTGGKVIETSTFRRAPESDADPNDPGADLLQRDDNFFGSAEEDARRRDFTVNGLFYDIASFSVIDYVNGMVDVRQRVIRSIGDPGIRFREDPIRMVRAVRFASRLGFAISPEDFAAISRHRHDLDRASPARLLEEICRLFAFSSGRRAMELLLSTGIMEVILPEVAQYLEKTADPSRFWRRLAALDKGDTVHPEASPALIFAAILGDPLADFLDIPDLSHPENRRRLERTRSFIDMASVRLSLPRKLREKLLRLIASQSRFQGPVKKRYTESMARQDWFSEALALAEIQSEVAGENPANLNNWREVFAIGAYGSPPSRTPENRPAAGEAPEGGERLSPGHGLSRSARRRRNRQRNKVRNSQPSTPAETPALPVPAATTTATVPAAAAAPASREEALPIPPASPPAAAPLPPARAGSPSRRGRGRRGGGRVATAPAAATDQPTLPGLADAAPAKPAKTSPAKKTESRQREGKSSRRSPPAVNKDAEEVSPRPLTAGDFYRPIKPAAGAETTPDAKSPARLSRQKDRPAKPGKDDNIEEPLHWLDEI